MAFRAILDEFAHDIAFLAFGTIPYMLVETVFTKKCAIAFIAAERASEAADLICAYVENLSQTMFTPVHCGCARSEMRSKLFIGCVPTTKF